jgi:hypothetical protein
VLDQVSGQIGEMLAPTFCPSLLDGEVLPFDIATLAHPGTKRLNKVVIGGRALGPQEPYTPHLARLCFRDEQMAQRADDARDESPTLHHRPARQTIMPCSGRPA